MHMSDLQMPKRSLQLPKLRVTSGEEQKGHRDCMGHNSIIRRR